MTRPILADAFGHHVWATIQLLDACLALTDEQLATAVPGTYGSILDTMRHLVGSDAGYLFVLSKGQVAEISEADEGRIKLADLRTMMERHGPIWDSVLAQDIDPDLVVARTRDDGTDSLAPMGIRLAQVIHHGTDHRSQVCTALTSLAIEPPAIDAWDFAEQGGRLSVVPTPA